MTYGRDNAGYRVLESSDHFQRHDREALSLILNLVLKITCNWVDTRWPFDIIIIRPLLRLSTAANNNNHNDSVERQHSFFV